MRFWIWLSLAVFALVSCTSTEELRLGAMQHFNRGNDHFAALDYKSAIGEYHQAIALFDEQPAFFYNLGLSYYNLVLYERAESAYRQALKLDPRLGEAWYNLSLVLDKQGKSDEAFVAYDRYQKLNAERVKEPPKPKPQVEMLGQPKPMGNLPQRPETPVGAKVPERPQGR
ncbi:MAG: tetratricopeptide repeat protein [bacterium]|nr:tetratricopeptide repeat protein [bacterium]